MAEETKTSTTPPAEKTDEPVASEKQANYVSGNQWICKGCGLSNDISSWNCGACFSSMKKSMQKDKNLRQRRDKTLKERQKKRQAKRDELRAKKSTSKEDEATKENEDEEVDSKQETDPEDEAQSLLKYKLSDKIPKVMRALIKEKEGKGYVLRTDYPVPTPKEDELLIRSFSVAICGSDAILYNWTKDAKTIAKLPFIPGHEAAGLIVGVGKNCRFRIGERVAIENHFYCGECYQCSINRKDICSNLQQFGHGKGTIYGGCCDYYVAKEKYCYRLKADISWRDAALLEPLGVAYNACDRADLNERSQSKQPQPKESVLIIGCGTIGCMAIGVAKTMPATGKIIALDTIERKLAVAKQMGADVTLNANKLSGSLKEEILKLTDNVGVGRIIECSGHAPTINKMFGCLRKGGAVTLVGLPKEPLTFDNPLQDIVFKSLQIRTIHGRRIFKTWNKTEKLVSEGKINLDLLVSHELSLNDFEKGYDALQSGKALKVVFNLTK
eukprot:180202_1